MKKQEFKTLEKYKMLQILGGITDPNNDPDEDTAPVDNPASSEEPSNPVDKNPDATRSRT
jgi:hypothetical protein